MLEPILCNISKNLIDDTKNVLKCSEIPTQIQKFYYKDIETFVRKHSGLLLVGSTEEKRKKFSRDICRGADFYYKKAREYFEFFGVNFEQPEKPKEFQLPKVNSVQLGSFLYSSVQMLYVVLWEVMQDFLKPLEKVYFQRLCDSGVFLKDYIPLPLPKEDVDKIKIDFIQDIAGRESGLYRVSENLPFELRLTYSLASEYYKKCFEEAEKSIGLKADTFVNDFISLFYVRNNVSHIGKHIQIQETSEEKMQKMLHSLTINLPHIQNSCIGIVALFNTFANSEPESKA